MTATGECHKPFRLGPLTLCHEKAAHKIGTDSVLLGAWFDTQDVVRIIDAGTGTGILALMAALRMPGSRITAVDISPGAVMEARANVQRNGLAERISIRQADIRLWRPENRQDLILANPPYFENRAGSNGRTVARSGGVAFLDALFALGAEVLTPDGRVALVWPVERRYDLLATAYGHGFSLCREMWVRDHPAANYGRMFSEWCRQAEGDLVQERLTMFRTPGGMPTEEYRQLAGKWVDL